jgi:hypothetical protein
MVNLGFSIGDLHFKNPVLTASGTFGYGLSLMIFLTYQGLEELFLRELLLNREKAISIRGWLKHPPVC